MLSLRTFCCLAFTAAWACLSAPALAQDKGKEPTNGDQPLPLKRVVLFSSSVGFFEHGGSVEGNQQIEFTFKTDDINDLLKSMVVQDRDGGLITAVNYGSPDPLTRTLRTFTIDLAESPTLAQIFQQLRGHEVKLETPNEVKGTIVGVEQRQVPLGDNKFVPVEVVNVRTSTGLRSIRLDTISQTNFTNPKVDKEFQQALDLIAGQHASDQKRVKLDFQGKGKRQVDVGYIQEAPVWKTTYRLVLDAGPDGKLQPFLQGWAIVENTTTQDWRDVQLTLVSGRPISFLMELSQPLFMQRPMVRPELHASLSPRVYDQDLASRDAEFRAAGQPRREQGFGGGGFAGGGGGGMGGGLGGGGMFGAAGGGRPMVTSVVPVVEDPFDGNLKLKVTQRQDVHASAIGGEVGELFRYVIKTPVSLPRSESAMLPIVNAPVKGEKVAIFNPTVHAKHPLAGLKLTNSTNLHLLQGPVTLFDGGEYAGDARIEDLAPGSSRLISYALDLETEIATEIKPEEKVITRLQIRKGGLFVKHKFTRQTVYTVKNSGDKAKPVLIERPIDREWTSTKPTPEETTREQHRYRLTAEPGKTGTLTINEERDAVGEVMLATLDSENMRLYAMLPVSSPKLAAAFEQLLAAKTKVAELSAADDAKEVQIVAIGQEQDRIRKNLQSLASIRGSDSVSEENKKTGNELLNKYLKRLGELDTEQEKVRLEKLRLEEDRKQAKQALDKLLAELVVD